MVASSIPCSFIRHSGGSICSEPEHAADQARRIMLQQTVKNLMQLTAGRKRFKVEIPVSNDVLADVCYFGYEEPAKVTIRGRWKVNKTTGLRYISFMEVLGPSRGLSQARAKYRLEADGGVMFAYIWAISNSVTAQIDQALARMVEQPHPSS